MTVLNLQVLQGSDDASQQGTLVAINIQFVVFGDWFGYGKPRSTTATGSLNMKVQKYGRTTGHTHGTITGIRATITVNYRTGKARFVNQLVITGKGTFSQGGDSGSLIVSEALGKLDHKGPQASRRV